MTDVHHLPDAKDAERQASEWIARLQADDVTAADRQAFQQWHDAHPVHARAWAELSETWRRLVAIGPFVRAVSFAQSVNDSVGTRPLRRRWSLAAAATVLLATALVTAYVLWLAPGQSFRTAVGEHARITLDDGSILELNSNSLARVRYRPDSRVIRLERGEAYFQVAHDAQRPFWVVSQGSWVRAVGTAFNVYVRRVGLRVTVSEGAVKVGAAQALFLSAPADEAAAAMAPILSSGQQAELEGADVSARRLSSVELARSMAWRQGTLDFDNADLGAVIDELGRYTTLHLVIEEESLRQLPVGGTFQASPQGAEALLAMLEQGFGLHVHRSGTTVYISGSTEPTAPRAVTR
jgi:transmembrane sensor